MRFGFGKTTTVEMSPRTNMWMCAALAMFFTISASATAGVSIYRATNWATVEATVLEAKYEVVERSTRHGRRTEMELHVSYEFETPEGRLIQGRDTIGHAKNITVHVGDQIEVRYAASAPESNMTSYGLRGLHIFSALFATMGVLCWVVTFHFRGKHMRGLSSPKTYAPLTT